MGISGEAVQFQILEEKVDALIAYTASLKQKNERLVEKLHVEKERTNKLMNEIENFKKVRISVRQRIATLLKRIEQADA